MIQYAVSDGVVKMRGLGLLDVSWGWLTVLKQQEQDERLKLGIHVSRGDQLDPLRQSELCSKT